MDFLYFLSVPVLIFLIGVFTFRGHKRSYKIVRETNSLGESNYEVWFEYYSLQGTHGWLLEKTFETEEQANEFIASQHKIREVIREGKL